MKGKVTIAITMFILLGISVGIYLTKSAQSLQRMQSDPTVQEVAIYVDPVSFPSLLQMVEIVKSDPNVPKFIFWERRKNLPKEHPALKNATIVQRKGLSYIDLSLNDKVIYLKWLKTQIQDFVHKYPNAKFILHMNIHHSSFIWAILGGVPADKIKHIFWYEESFGVGLFDWDTHFEPLPKAIFDSLFSEENYLVKYPKFAALPFYPSTVYIAHPEEVAVANPEKYNCVKKYAEIRAINYNEIAQSLTQAQKESLLKLAGLSEDHMAYFKQGKPVMLNVLGVSLDSVNWLDKVQLADLDRVFEGKFGSFNPDDYVWLAKEHPWLKDDNMLKKSILKKYPFFHFLPKDFPLEVLFLSGYVPDKIFGYSSSIFFAVPDAKHVLFYIPRPQDPYVPWLIKFGKLKKEQIYVGDNI